MASICACNWVMSMFISTDILLSCFRFSISFSSFLLSISMSINTVGSDLDHKIKSDRKRACLILKYRRVACWIRIIRHRYRRMHCKKRLESAYCIKNLLTIEPFRPRWRVRTFNRATQARRFSNSYVRACLASIRFEYEVFQPTCNLAMASCRSFSMRRWCNMEFHVRWWLLIQTTCDTMVNHFCCRCRWMRMCCFSDDFISFLNRTFQRCASLMSNLMFFRKATMDVWGCPWW